MEHPATTEATADPSAPQVISARVQCEHSGWSAGSPRGSGTGSRRAGAGRTGLLERDRANGAELPWRLIATRQSLPARLVQVIQRIADESACKPGPVQGSVAGLPCAAIHLGLSSPSASCGLPVSSGGSPSNAHAGPVHASGPLDLAPGGVCIAAPVTWGAGGLLHHRFTLTPRPRTRGGLLSVALSRGSPRVGVTHHPALRSPDFPRRLRPEDRAAAAARPTHPPAQGIGAAPRLSTQSRRAEQTWRGRPLVPAQGTQRSPRRYCLATGPRSTVWESQRSMTAHK